MDRIRTALVVLASALLMGALAVPAQAALPRGFVGLTSEDAFGGSPAYQLSAFRAQRAVGVTLLRQTFDWSRIEPLPGYYDLGVYDRYVGAAATNGLTVLPVLFNAPSFYASGPAGRVAYPPRNPLDMARFAAALVRRYGPSGSFWATHPGIPNLPIRSWQVWNEPSLPGYWGGRPNARRYVALLSAVGAAIKAEDPGAEIVTAGIPPSFLSGSIPIEKYISQMYRAGGKSAFDTLAVNSYALGAGDLKRRLTSIRKLMNRNGDRGAPIWITELGWCDKGVRHRFCVGAVGQAKRISASLKVIRQKRRALRLRGFVYFSWRDGRRYAPRYKDLWGLHTGLLNLSGGKKKAFKAFKGAAKKFR